MKIFVLPFLLIANLAMLLQSQEPAGSQSQIEESLSEVEDLVATIQQHHIGEPDFSDLVVEAIRNFTGDSSPEFMIEVQAKWSSSKESLQPHEFIRKEILKSPSKISFSKECAQGLLPTLALKVSGVREMNSVREAVVARQLLANQYVGIGVQLEYDKQEKRALFTEVFENGTASLAKIGPSDLLLSVDGNDTFQVPLADVVSWLRGPSGTQVEVEVQSTQDKSIRKLILSRRVIPLPTLTLMRQGSSNATAIIQFSRVASSCVQELQKAEGELAPTTRLVILDWRRISDDNLHNLHLLMDALLDETTVGFVETKQAVRRIETETGRLFVDRRIAIVVSDKSSMATQWAASCLRDQGVEVFAEYPVYTSQQPHVVVLPKQPANGSSGTLSQQAVSFELLPINHERGSISIVTGKLLDRDRQKVLVMKPGYLNGTGQVPLSGDALSERIFKLLHDLDSTKEPQGNE